MTLVIETRTFETIRIPQPAGWGLSTDRSFVASDKDGYPLLVISEGEFLLAKLEADE